MVEREKNYTISVVTQINQSSHKLILLHTTRITPLRKVNCTFSWSIPLPNLSAINKKNMSKLLN